MDQGSQVIKSFRHQLRDWSIIIELNESGQCSIEFLITSKADQGLSFKGCYVQRNIPEQVRDPALRTNQQLFEFLLKQNSKKETKIFEFYPEFQTLRFAYHKVKKVECLSLQKYIEGVKQQDVDQLVLKSKFRKSISAQRATKKSSIIESLQQVLIQTLTLGNDEKAVDPLQESKINIYCDSDEEYDYQEWLKSGKDSIQEIELIKFFEKQEILLQIEKPLVKQVSSQIIKEPEMKKPQSNESKIIKQVVLENFQLRKQKTELLQRLALLEKENENLKSQLQKYEQEKKVKKFQLSSSDSFNQNYPIGKNQPSFLQKMNAKSYEQFNWVSNKLQLEKTSSSRLTFTPDMRDQWAQQYENSKRPISESEFLKYFDLLTGKFDISYKMLPLKQFEMNFFPFGWTEIQVLNIDGNFLSSQGFNQITKMFLPYLKQISAGYNLIVDVKSLQNLQSLVKVDLRANPLSVETKFFLRKLRESRKMESLF